MTMPPSRRLEFSEVPVVDIGPLVKGGPAHARDAVAALAKACSEVGFIQVINHGVPRDALERLIDEAARFFAQPLEDRLKVAIENSPQFRGYLPLKYKGEIDEGDNLQEAFIIFHELPLSDTCPMYGPNQWPQGMPGFKRAMLDYFVVVEQLARAMLPGFAAALELSHDFFAPLFNDSMMMLKLNHYPAQDAPEHVKEIGVVGHSDSGAFTILWQDDVGGLEILNKTGEWVVVPPIRGAYVINLGNIMQIWTNGRFSSTPHRVINRYGRDRYSIPLFVNPNYDTVVKPLFGDAPADFTPFISGDYQRSVYRRIYPQRPSLARNATPAGQ